MQITESKQGEALVLALQGHLDADSAWPLEGRLENAIKSGVRQIALDCAGLSYINSSGLKALFSTHNLMSAAGGRFVVSGLRQNVASIFEMVGFTRILAVAPSLADALAALQLQEHRG